ncbi:MAG: SAM-dependent chlorinase/fluorinase [Candidatus Methanomethyliales bacterium]|nr:SAM-dependent chlorinase/fluorinase [Candidatus Methanomethylicales archaeon]
MIVTLTTDFDGHYVGIMKGVIKRIAPRVEVIDLGTDVQPFDVKGGAFVLYSSYKYFPSGTVHVVVVDPGVGSERRAIAVKSRNYYFVGPDNGVLVPAAREDGVVEIREISNRELFLEEISSTFHGRDIFSPVAAFLANGGEFEKVGGKIDNVKELEFFRTVGEGRAEGEVLFVDRFGNLVTSLLEGDLTKKEYVIEFEGKRLRARCVMTYSEGREGEILIIKGSSGHYEISIREGSAKEVTGLTVGRRFAIVDP